MAITKEFRHGISMDIGRRDGVSKIVSFSDFAHIFHEWVPQANQVDADIALTRR